MVRGLHHKHIYIILKDVIKIKLVENELHKIKINQQRFRIELSNINIIVVDAIFSVVTINISIIPFISIEVHMLAYIDMVLSLWPSSIKTQKHK